MVHHQRFLYTAVVKQDGTVEIRRKMSDLVAGHTSYVGAVNNAVTGITSIRPTTTVSMRSRGWAPYTSPGAAITIRISSGSTTAATGEHRWTRRRWCTDRQRCAGR